MVSAAMFHGNSQHATVSEPSAMSGSSANGNASAGNLGSNISADDFLTLLVTEMKNQDPTSAQDPNQYVNQLVSVNSLEQLIQINETLSGALYPYPDAQAGPSGSATADEPSGAALHTPQPIHGRNSQVVSGNLGVPETSPAAHRVAQALGHRASRL